MNRATVAGNTGPLPLTTLNVASTRRLGGGSELLFQAFFNLVDNAIKHSPACA